MKKILIVAVLTFSSLATYGQSENQLSDIPPNAFESLQPNLRRLHLLCSNVADLYADIATPEIVEALTKRCESVVINTGYTPVWAYERDIRLVLPPNAFESLNSLKDLRVTEEYDVKAVN